MKTVNICGIPHTIRYKHTIAEEDEELEKWLRWLWLERHKGVRND